MQFHQLEYFVAVADARHFTQAADRAGVSQPSLSQQIKALERDVGAPLFHRFRGNITLTEAGEILLPVARRILADADTARHEIRELGELRRGRIRLGATPSLCTGLLPPMLAAFRRDHPGVQLIVHEGGSRDLHRDLIEGGLDLALVIDSRGRPDDPHLVTLPLLDEELVLISALDAPPPAAAPAPATAAAPAPTTAAAPTRTATSQAGTEIDVSALETLPLVMFRPGYDLRDATIAACRDAGFEPTFAVEGGEMDAVLQFVAAGLGVAIVPSTVAGDRFRTTSFVKPGLRRTVRLAHRRDMAPPRAARALRDALIASLRAAAADGTLPAGTRALMPLS